MRQRFYEVADELVADDPRVVLVMADIGVAAVGDHERVVNVGIREQLMVGVASGLALEGYRPIAHSYAPFLVQRPWEQLKLDLGHQGVGAVLVSVGASYDAASAGRTHQAPEDVALLSTLPGWTIHVPGHGAEMESHLRRAVAEDGNAYIRLEALSNRASHDSSGSVVAVREGTPDSPVVLAVGPMLDQVMEALAGIDVTVAYTSTVRPLDLGGVRDLALGRTTFAIVEPYLEGTSHFELSRALSDRPVRLGSFGYRRIESRRYGTAEEHRRAHGLDGGGLRERLTTFFDRSEARAVLV